MSSVTQIIVFVISGLFSGVTNFFLNYLELPFSKSSNYFLEVEWPRVTSMRIAFVGYILAGIMGSFLTPLVNALVGLKGFNSNDDYLVLFGYGLVFGFFSIKLLTSILDPIIRRISKIEKSLARINASNIKESQLLNTQNTDVERIINECEAQFDAHKSDCSGFVKAVGSKLGVILTGQADNIVDQIQGEGWEILPDGVSAKVKADMGWFVIGGLKSENHTPPVSHGHVVIVVSGPLARNQYPTGYWGSLGSSGMKKVTINYAWRAVDRDNLVFAGRPLS